jgi:RAB protein geranylgeranyltransferase component A
MQMPWHQQCRLSYVPLHQLQVLHMDRNSYYGGASASLNLTQVGSISMGLATACVMNPNAQLWHYQDTQADAA